MDDQVGTPRLHEWFEVLDHPGGPDAGEEAGNWNGIRSAGGMSAQPGVAATNRAWASGWSSRSWMGLEPDVPNMAAEAGIGRECDAMSGSLESTRQRNHRVEVALTDHAGEKDLHPAEPTSSENRV